MKDAYSLHATTDSMVEWYETVRAAYERTFDALGVDVAICEAENSVMGGSRSEEFVAPVDDGTCALVHCQADDCRFGVTDEHATFDRYRDGDRDCPDCGSHLRDGDGVEVGHVFQLGTRYAEAMDLTVDADDGETTAVEMASYGIGVTRVLQTLLAQHGDADGCRWPERDAGTVAPYEVSIVPLRYDGEIKAAADRIHGALAEANANDANANASGARASNTGANASRDGANGGCDGVLLFDDADQTIGERFAESDLLGVPTKVVLGNHYRETGEVELESRDGDTRYLALEDAIAELRG